MGRVRENIRIGDRDCWTLFDTGSRNTYVAGGVAKGLMKVALSQARQVALGGTTHAIHELVAVEAHLRGYSVDFDAYVLPEIGLDEDGKRIEVVFGALAMQKWGIRVVPADESLDLTHYPKEFVEF